MEPLADLRHTGLRAGPPVEHRRRDRRGPWLRGAPGGGWRVLLVQSTVGLDITVAGAHPDIMLLLPVAAGMAAGPEEGAVVGFVAGMAADLLLPTPFGLIGPGGMPGGLRRGLHHRVDHPGGVVVPAAGRARGERRVGHAVRRARGGARRGAVRPGRPGGRGGLVVAVVNAVLAAPGGPGDRLGARWPSVGRRARPAPPGAAGEAAHPPPPAPRRPLLRQAPATGQASPGEARRRPARQPRMRPRRSVNVAAVVASPEETALPARSCACRSSGWWSWSCSW